MHNYMVLSVHKNTALSRLKKNEDATLEVKEEFSTFLVKNFEDQLQVLIEEGITWTLS